MEGFNWRMAISSVTTSTLATSQRFENSILYVQFIKHGEYNPRHGEVDPDQGYLLELYVYMLHAPCQLP